MADTAPRCGFFLTAQVLIMLGVRVQGLSACRNERLCWDLACRLCVYTVDPRSLPGIFEICEAIRENIAGHTRECLALDGPAKEIIIEEYIESQDYMWD